MYGTYIVGDASASSPPWRTSPTIPTISYDERAAAWHADERVRLEKLGKTPPFIDGQIAAVALTNGLPQQDCYVNVLRNALAVDSLDSCGIYFGTTGGQVYASNDSGDHWQAVAEHLPAVLSVEVQTIR